MRIADIETYAVGAGWKNGLFVHLSLPDGPGLGIDLDIEAIRAHPYDPDAYLNVHEKGWERRLGAQGRRGDAAG